MHITSIEPIKGNTKKVLVHIDGGYDLCLYRGELRRLGLGADSELSEETYHKVIAEILIPRAKKRAMYLLEKQDRSKAKLKEKLIESLYPDEVCEEAIAYVEAYHYIDDDRYAENYVHYHKSDKTRRRLKQDLLKRGISADTAEKAIECGYDVDEADIARRLIEKKGYDPNVADIRLKSKMYRFLMSRGFSSDTVNEVLRKDN